MINGCKKNFQLVRANTMIQDERYRNFRRRWDHCASQLELGAVPLNVDIEITNRCNLKCSMCERNKMTRKIGSMDYGFFSSIIDQCRAFEIPSVKLNLWGESLLHKDLFRMIEYAKNNNVYTQFNTNVTLLTEEVIRKLIASGLDRITFSVESFVKDVYEGARKGADFGATMKNIEDFIRLKPAGEKPFLTLQAINMKKNHRDIRDFVERFKDKVDFISVTNICTVDGDEKILEESMIDYKSLPKIPCPELWLRLSVFWNGDVTACCQDYDGFLTIGNIKNKSLKELWQSKKLNELREKHKKLDFSGLICSSCTANHESQD